MLDFWEYKLTARRLCLGERTRGGIFRPTARTIPYSQVTGALKARFGMSNLHACGSLDTGSEVNEISYLTYSPRDVIVGVSKVPLTVQFLENVQGRVFVSIAGNEIQEHIDIPMGAMRSVGFGQCKLEKVGKAPVEMGRGILNTRIPERLLDEFGIIPVRRKYGYLFKPDENRESGNYELALVEGSVIVGPKFLRKEEPSYVG